MNRGEALVPMFTRIEDGVILATRAPCNGKRLCDRCGIQLETTRGRAARARTCPDCKSVLAYDKKLAYNKSRRENQLTGASKL